MSIELLWEGDRLRSAKSYHAKTSPSAAMNSSVLTGLLRGKGRHDTRSGPGSLSLAPPALRWV